MTPDSNVTYDYRDNTVLVTGAARGLGRSHALAFAGAGADLVVCDLGAPIPGVSYRLGSSDDLDAVAEEARALGVRCETVACDVSDAEQVQAAVRHAHEAFGKIDVLVNNAGVVSLPSVLEMTEQQWDQVVDVSLKGTFLMSKYAAPGMVDRRRGKIINTSSTCGLMGLPNQAHYCAAKHGVIGFSRALALELAPHDINVNVVAPGAIDTPLNSELRLTPEAQRITTGVTDLAGAKNVFDGTSLDPADITAAVLFLASEAAHRMTGAVVVVDAGFTIK